MGCKDRCRWDVSLHWSSYSQDSLDITENMHDATVLLVAEHLVFRVYIFYYIFGFMV